MDQKGSMAWPRDMALGPAPAMQGTGSDGLRLSSLAPSVVARSRRPQLAVSSPVPSVLSASVRVATVSTPAALADADGTGSTKAPYEQFTALQSPQMLQAQQQVEFQKSYLQHQQAQEAKTPKSGQRSGGLAGQHRLQAALSRPAASARGVLSTPRSVDPLEGVVNHVLSGEYPPDHPPPTPPAATDGAHSNAQPWASPLAAAAPPPQPQPPVAASPTQQRPQGLVVPHAAVSGAAGAKERAPKQVLQTGTLLSQLQLQERQHQARPRSRSNRNSRSSNACRAARAVGVSGTRGPRSSIVPVQHDRGRTTTAAAAAATYCARHTRGPAVCGAAEVAARL